MSNHQTFNNSKILPKLLTTSLIFQYTYTPSSISHSEYLKTHLNLKFNITTISKYPNINSKLSNSTQSQIINNQTLSSNSNLYQFITFPQKSICTHTDPELYFKTLAFLETTFQQSQYCTMCDSDDQTLVCIFCQQTLCSRKVNSHMAFHRSQQPSHSAALYSRTGTVYCYQCNNYVNLVVSPNNSPRYLKHNNAQTQNFTCSNEPKPFNAFINCQQPRTLAHSTPSPALPHSLSLCSMSTQTDPSLAPQTPRVKSRTSTIQTPKRFLEATPQVKSDNLPPTRIKYKEKVKKRKKYIQKMAAAAQPQQPVTTVSFTREPTVWIQQSRQFQQDEEIIQIVQSNSDGIVGHVLSNLTGLGIPSQQIPLLLSIIVQSITNKAVSLSAINQTFEWLRQQPPDEAVYHLVNFLAPYFPPDSDDDISDSENENQLCTQITPPLN